jgi:glycosyltransferase involved in cell wall biosynthesis
VPTKVKVIHLITLLELGGAQGNTLHTVKHLNPDRFETHLWTGQGAYWDQAAQRDLASHGRLRFFRRLVRNINPFADFLIIFDLLRALKKEKPDILHTHSSKAGIVGRIAGALAGVPVIIHTFHGFGFNNQQKPWIRSLFVWLERKTAPLATMLIFVSKSNMEDARKEKIGEESQYLLIRSGIPILDIEKKSPSKSLDTVKKELSFPANSTVITTIGAFKPQKNLSDFLQVASALSKTSADICFLIIGDGEQRPRLESLIDKLGLAGRVVMPGWRNDIPELLAISDVFVLTSLWEGLPRALLEAMIAGIPAVCYVTDGVTDVLDEKSGVLIKQGNISGMVEAIQRILSDSTFRRILTENARHKIGQEFDIDFMVRQQESLYEQLLASTN